MKRLELETYLKRKWGIIEGCKFLLIQLDMMSGCNTAGEAEGFLVESACSVSCGAGYSADNFEEVTATCVIPGSDFMLHGCYLDDVNFKDDEPNFIRLKNALWLDAGSGIVEADGKVSSWTSRPNKNSSTFAFTQQNVGVSARI